MRKVLFGSLTALAVMGCGQVDAPAEPFPAPAPLGLSSRHQLIGEFRASIMPRADGRSAEWIPTVADNQMDSNPPQTVEVYSHPNVLTSSTGHNCVNDLSAMVTVKSYFQDQLRNVAVEVNRISNSSHYTCNHHPKPYPGLTDSFYFPYGVLDSAVSRGAPQSSEQLWAFNFVEATDFIIGFRVWAILWPEAPSEIALLHGATIEGNGPLIAVSQYNEATAMLSTLYTDAAMTSAVADSDWVSDPVSSGQWEINPVGNSPPLDDNTTYYVAIRSQGPDNNTPTAGTITGSQYLADSFLYIAPVEATFPLTGTTNGSTRVPVSGAANKRLTWTSSALSTKSVLSISKCGSCACGASTRLDQVTPLPPTNYEQWVGKTIPYGGPLTSAPVSGAPFVSGTCYLWTVQQFPGGVAGTETTGQIFKYTN